MKKQNESSIDLLLDQIPLAVGENYFFFFCKTRWSYLECSTPASGGFNAKPHGPNSLKVSVVH